MFTELTIGGETYILRVTTSATMQIEKNLGYSPMDIFMRAAEEKLPTTTELVYLLHGCLISMNHGFTVAKTADLLDAYIADGHNQFEIFAPIVEVFKNAGYLPGEDEVSEGEAKN